MEKYGLDPAHYYTAPGLSWDALLKMTGVELELLTDQDMHLFIEKGMRSGIDGEQAVREDEQPAGGRLGPKQAEQINHVPGRERPVRLGHEPAAAQRRLQVEEGDAHRRANPEAERKPADRVDLGGGLGVLGGAPRSPQQLPACAREKGGLGGADVRIPRKMMRDLGLDFPNFIWAISSIVFVSHQL